jgi:hypothetical protein
MPDPIQKNFLDRAYNLLTKLWGKHRDGLIKILPGLAALLGVLAIALPMWIQFSDSVSSSLRAFGASILASGIFALMMKYLQFMGVFEEELGKLLRSPDFRHQLVDFHIASAGMDQNFTPYPMRRYLELTYPELVAKYDGSTRYFSGGYYNYYFSELNRRIFIKSIDEHGTMCIDDVHIFVAKPLRPEDQISFGFQLSKSDVPLGAAGSDFYCEVDTIDCTSELNWTARGGVTFSKQLCGKPEYRVKRRFTRKLSVLSSITMTLQRLAINLTVEIRNEVPNEVGTHLEFLNVFEYPLDPIPRSVGGAIEKEFKLLPLMLPQQGYVLSFQPLRDVALPATTSAANA